MGAFGEKFRQERERRGITLDAVSNTTKISTRMLKAIEDEHFDQLPGGVFNKGFIRAYARQVGIDEEEAVTGYLTALREGQINAQSFMPEFHSVREPQIPVQSAPAQPVKEAAPPDLPPPTLPKPGAPKPTSPKPTLPKPEPSPIDLMEQLAAHRPAPLVTSQRKGAAWRMPAAVLMLVVLTVTWLAYRRRDQSAATPTVRAATQLQTVSAAPRTDAASPGNGTATQKTTAGKSSATLQPATPSSAAVPAPSIELRHEPAGASQLTASASAHPAGELSLPSAAPASSTTPASSAKSSSSKKADGSATLSSAAPAGSVTTPAATKTPGAGVTARVSANNAAKMFKLVIRAEETSWVLITVDGKPVAEETLIAPAGKAIRANEEIMVKAGNAGGLSFIFNDKELPKQGESGEVKTFVFDAQGMRLAPGGQGDSNR